MTSGWRASLLMTSCWGEILVSQRVYPVLRCTLHTRCEEVYRISHTPHCGLRPYVGLQRECLFETYSHKVVGYSSLQDTGFGPGLGEASSLVTPYEA